MIFQVALCKYAVSDSAPRLKQMTGDCGRRPLTLCRSRLFLQPAWTVL